MSSPANRVEIDQTLAVASVELGGGERRALLRALGWGIALLLGLVALQLAFAGAPPLPAQPAPSSEFSIERALGHVRALTQSPGPAGSEGNAERRRYIIEQLTDLGIEAEVQSTDAVVSMLGRVVAARVNNVVGRLAGRQPGPAIMLSAHYDTVPNSPGASDDGAGVATLLETARVLREGGPLRRDVVLLFTDGEELGLLGSVAFVSEHPWRKDVALSLNFEARGSRGASAMYETSLPNRGLIESFADSAKLPIGNSLISTLSRALPNDTDFTVFRRSGMAGYAFAFADGFTRYHRATDSLERLDPRSLEHHGSYATSLARSLANAATLPVASGNVVYFDAFGKTVLWYPEWLARALGIGLGGAATLLIWQAHRRGWARAARVWLGVLVCVGCLLGAMLAAVALDAAIGLLLPKEQRIDWAAGLFIAHFACALLACVEICRRALRRASSAELLLGALSVGALLSFVLGSWLPGASYAPQWLTLSGLLGWWLVNWRQGGARRQRADVVATWWTCASLAPTAFFVGSCGYAFYVLIGTQLPAASTLAVGWGAALLLPFSAALWLPHARRLQGLLMLGTATSATVIAMLARFAPPPPTFTDFAYALDQDAKRAHWLASVGTQHDWVRAALGRHEVTEYIPGKATLAAAAPIVALGSSQVALVSDVRQNGQRRLALSVELAPGARCVSLLQLSGAVVRSSSINAKFPHPNVRFGPEIDKKLWYIVTGERLSDGWSLSYCGSNARPLLLELVMTDQPLELRVIDTKDGLPVAASALLPRPEGLFFDINGNCSLAKRDLIL
jgi:hypothetical protein